jgi:hypothetical protein
MDGLRPSDIAVIEELIGAYVLDALEPDEVAVVDAHLGTCPRCRQEVAALLEVAGQIGSGGQEAPPGVWDKIAARLPEAPPMVDLDRSSLEGPPRELATVTPLRSARSRRPRFLAPLVGLAAAVVIAVLGVQVVHLDNRVDTVSHKLSAVEAPNMGSVGAAIASPGAKQVTLTPASGGPALARVVIQTDGTGYMYDSSMPALAADRTYELWGIVDDHRVPYGVLGDDPRGVTKFKATGQAATLAVTNEKGGGVATSTKAPVVLGTVTPV